MNIVFTDHAKERMEKKKNSEDEVIDAIEYAEKTEKIDDVYYTYKKLDRFTLKVVYVRENYIKVVTLHPL